MQRVRLAIFLLAGLFFSFTLSSAQPSELKKYWVYFRDKGPQIAATGPLAKTSPAWERAAEILSLRAIQRRAKIAQQTSLITADDVPLYQPYLDDVVRAGGELQRQSRWLNAASFFLTPEQRLRAEDLPFVERITPVRVFYRHDDVSESHSPFSAPGILDLDYGPSFAQADMIGATKVHALGVTGDSVIVGMLDTGFRWRVHESLQNARVIAEHDFIQNDDTTANQAGDAPNQDQHGTLTMSVIGGYKPGQLIGAAFGVQFLLAKTEYVPTETRIEEDNWMAGIEWMESQGVDVVSSSLGYNIFDDGTGYRWDNGDFNGRTAVTSRAAVRAVRLGVVVCDAMGNEGNGDGVRGTMLVPADADSILSVGAVTFSRSLATFSSTGPTNDGRVKPELVAPGVGVYGAFPGQSSYWFVNGTSLATPLVASSAALVLSARKDLTAMQVRDALRATADSIATSDPRAATRPNNFVGWGLVNAFKAISYPTLDTASSVNRITIFVGSASGIFTDSVRLVFSSITSASQSSPMTRMSGPALRSNGVYRADISGFATGTFIRFWIIAVDSSGGRVRIPRDSTNSFSFAFGSKTLFSPLNPLPTTSVLLQNYPNPFNSTTVIRFDSPIVQEGTVMIYNLLGQKVKTVYDGLFQPGVNTFIWDGRNDNGITAASGVYLYNLRTSRFLEVKKMILLR